MVDQWRLSAEESHVLFVAFWENAEQGKIKECGDNSNMGAWIDTLKGAPPLVIAPTDSDVEFFPILVDLELVRLAPFDHDAKLPCGCGVFAHRHILQQFRIKNIFG